MDATYLQQELGLKDSHRIFTSTEGMDMVQKVNKPGKLLKFS